MCGRYNKCINFEGEGHCPAGSRWKCSDDMCISPELHCDKVPHCLDLSDEVINCSNSGSCWNIRILNMDPCSAAISIEQKIDTTQWKKMQNIRLNKYFIADNLPSIYKCDSGGGTFPCVSNKWNERWFGVAIPMLIVLVLFLVAFVVKVRNIICRPPETQGLYHVLLTFKTCVYFFLPNYRLSSNRILQPQK